MRGQISNGSVRPENVIPFGTYHTAMTQPILAEIRTYWEELRGGRLMPLRSEIDPREMSSFLEVCFVLERTMDTQIRFRLAGLEISDIMGMEVRGMTLRSLISPDARDQFDAQIDAVFETPEIQEYKLVAQERDAPELVGNMLILPLKSETGETDRAIGCLSTQGIVGTPPRRFRVTELQRTSLLTGLSETDRHIQPAPETASFAEAQAPYQAQAPHPYLRVVK